MGRRSPIPEYGGVAGFDEGQVGQVLWNEEDEILEVV